MTDQPCALVIKHEGTLGEIKGLLAEQSRNISYIKAKVDDGLSTKVASIEKDLAQSISEGKLEAAEIKADVEVKAAELKGEDWLKRIVTGSVAKLIGIGVGFIILNSLSNSALTLYLKENYSKETPGQQEEILKKQDAIQQTLSGYHSHVLSDGATLFHSGDVGNPAWVFNPKTGAWIKAPSMRTENGVK